MKKNMKWIMPLSFVAIIGIFVLIAANFADNPVVYARGQVSLSKELIEKAQNIETMFIVVYDADSGMPMPYGAMRDNISVDQSGNLGEFILTPARLQVMRPEIPFPNNIRIKIRLDRDGQGGRDQPGDLTGELAKVAVGSAGLQLKITTEIN